MTGLDECSGRRHVSASRGESITPVAVRARSDRGPFTSVGWSLGSACPYSCTHCYSRSMRVDADQLTPVLIERIIDQLASVGVKTVTLGGNEPIYTNGLSLGRSQLPFIVRSLRAAEIRVALVTSGPSATILRRVAPDAFAQLDMVFVSLDAPTAQRHDQNRGAKLFDHAKRALQASVDSGVDRAILYCAHRGNFGPVDVDSLVDLAASSAARVRINTMKPVGLDVDRLVLDPASYLAGFGRLVERCRTDLVDEPVLRALLGLDARRGCPCGTTTFRISHARSDGSIPVSPCIYGSSRFGDLRTDSLSDILGSSEFGLSSHGRGVGQSPGSVAVGGGCTAQALLGALASGTDPMIDLVDRGATIESPVVREDELLRERFGGYLCTWFGTPL